MHELISLDSAIDPLVTSQSGVCCKPTSVSHPAVKFHSLYRCRLVLRTPYACSPEIDGSVLIVAGRECIVVFGSVFAPPLLLGMDASSVLCCYLGAESPNLPHVYGLQTTQHTRGGAVTAVTNCCANCDETSRFAIFRTSRTCGPAGCRALLLIKSRSDTNKSEFAISAINKYTVGSRYS